MIIISTYDLISILIAFIALIFSAFSIVYTTRNNRYIVRVSDPTIEKLDAVTYRLCFGMQNNSARSLTVESITFSTRDGLLTPLDFDIEHYNETVSASQQVAPIECEKHFGINIPLLTIPSLTSFDILPPSDWEYQTELKDFVLVPYEEKNITVYLQNSVEHVTVTLTSEHKITLTSKTKTFSIYPRSIDTE